MIHFSKLFRFSRTEIKDLYLKAKLKKKVLGLKLLQSPISFCDLSSEQQVANLEFDQQKQKSEICGFGHGRILIVVPRAFGNACKRNLFRRRIKALFYENKLYRYQVNSILIAYSQAQDFSINDLKNFLITNIPIKSSEYT